MGQNEEDDEWVSVPVSKTQVRIILTVVFTALISGVGYPVISMVSPARHDAWTKTMDDERHNALINRLQTVEWEQSILTSDCEQALEEVRVHEKEAEGWKHRIIRIEEQLGFRRRQAQ